MGYTVNAIDIKADVDRVFAITNDTGNWVRLMGYKAVELLERTKLPDDRELIRFRITNQEEEDGKLIEESWTSHRIIDSANHWARGVRENPMFPFIWWILDISYDSYDRLGPNLTKMTWTQDFSIDPKTGHTDEEIEGYINQGSLGELQKVRDLIEAGEF